MIKAVARVRQGNYMSIGFGSSMRDTDMLIFQGDNGGMVTDSWSGGNYTPRRDSQQDWKVGKSILGSDGFYHFEVTRELVTNDSEDI